MRVYIKTLVALLTLLTAKYTHAQLTVNAGNDTAICLGQSVYLGGTPLVTGGNSPYTYAWSSGEFSSNPLVAPLVTTTYSVTVTDMMGATGTDAVTVSIISSPTVDLGPDIFSCQPQVQLVANIIPGQGGPGPVCSGPNLQTEIGHDTLMFPFLPLNHPSVLGNYAHSYRNQMLYTAAELSAAMVSGNTINKIGFNVTRFNSVATLQNYSIRIGATNQTTLSAWDNSLTLVYSSAGISANPGWNVINLNNGFVWDGFSNLIVEVCMYAPTAFGSQPNDVASSITATNSYLYSYDSVDQCGGINPATASNLRPNIRFGYCNETILPYTLMWSPATGLSNPQVSNPIATVQGTTTFHITVTGGGACTATDSVTVSLSNLHIAVDSIGDASCANVFDGEIELSATGGASPYTYSLNGGPQQSNGIFTGLQSGTYMCAVQDINGCTDTSTVIVGETGVTLNAISQVPVSCFGNADGSVSVQLNGGITPYQYSIDGGLTYQAPGVFNGLVPGPYTITGQDAIGCTNQVQVVIIGPTQVVVSLSNTGDGILPDTLEAAVTGGCSPYMYNWSNAGNTPQNIISTAGSYGITVTDCSGCTANASAPVGGITFSVAHTNVSCFGGNTGSATLTVVTSNPPQVITWSNNATGATITNLNAGTYTYTYSDALPANSFSGSVTITETAQLQLSAIVTDIDCFNSPTGAIDLTASGGTPVYNYNWGPGGIVIDDPTGLLAGTYTVTVMDINGCTTTGSYAVNQPTQIQVNNVIVTDVTCFGGMNGGACIQASGGTGAYTFAWNTNPPFSGSCGSNLVAGTYNVTITDANGCSATTTPTIIQPSELILDAITIDGVNTPDSLAYASATGGQTPYSYLWDNNIADSAFVLRSCVDGQLSVSVTDANGCQAIDSITFVVNLDCVWPGDADDNGVADNNDLLNIGIGYGTSGAARAWPSTGWNANYSIDWALSFTNGVNYKHADCDGTGLINADDTLAIIQNFGEVHSKNDESRDWRAGAPVLQVDLAPDTTQAGDTMYANIVLGDVNISATNVYGLAFTINYDVNVVDTTRTKMQFGNSWLGTAVDKINIAKDLKDGQIKCAITRIDHTTRSGAGQIGQATFVITTDNINGKDLAYYKHRVWVSDVVMIDNDGNVLDVNEGQDSSQVEYEPTGIAELGLRNADLKIQPNPANEVVQITLARELIGGNLKVLDMEGRVLLEKTITSSNFKLETSQLSAGIYLIRVNTTVGALTKRLLIAK